MDPIRYIMVGGFLGAGKTTTLARLASTYMQQGLKVGIVTNDQADDLVDTNMLRSMGFDVGEVAGACFCCHFDELMTTVERLSKQGDRPDIILAEPVGSCTDLVATVLQPIKRLFQTDFEIAPYTVILKPSHGRRVLNNESAAGFSPKAAYILKKQIEEADVVLINRADELSEQQIEQLRRLVQQQAPDRPVLPVSARTGSGFAELLEILNQSGDFGQRILDIDYDIYAAGEAELGWLNCNLTMVAETAWSLDRVLLSIVSRLKHQLTAHKFEAAHLKTIGLWEGFFGVANLVSSENEPELSLSCGHDVTTADIIVNARVACDPEVLQQLVTTEVQAIADEFGATVDFRRSQHFRPGRPVPTHRITPEAN